MLSAILSLAAPAILGPAGLSLVANPMVASAIGGGLGSLLQGGDTQDVLTGAALGGIGSAIGGSSAFGSNPAAPTTAAQNALTDPIAQRMGTGAFNSTTMSGLPGGSFTDALTRPEAIGAGLGGLAADSMIMPEYRKEEEEKEYPRGMPIKNTSVFPEFGYDAGKMGEFNYRIPRNFAEGG